MKKKIWIAALMAIIVFGAFAGLPFLQELRRITSDDPLAWESTIAELVNKTAR